MNLLVVPDLIEWDTHSLKGADGPDWLRVEYGKELPSGKFDRIVVVLRPAVHLVQVHMRRIYIQQVLTPRMVDGMVEVIFMSNIT